jgi:hypothetical protein
LRLAAINLKSQFQIKFTRRSLPAADRQSHLLKSSGERENPTTPMS